MFKKGKNRSIPLNKDVSIGQSAFIVENAQLNKILFTIPRKLPKLLLQTFYDIGKLVDIRSKIEFVNGEPDFLTTFLDREVKYHHNCTAIYRSKILKSFDEEEGMSTPEKCKTRSEHVTTATQQLFFYFLHSI